MLGWLPGWKSAFVAVRNAILRLGELASEDGSDLARVNPAPESSERASVVDKHGEEIATYVRSVIENGYFEEDSGDRVFVPW